MKEEAELVKKIKGRKKLSINPLIPKPHTPFQWLAFEEISEIKRRFKLFRKYMQGKAEIEIENLKKAFLQTTISRGDEKLGDIIEKAFYYGKGMGAFRRAFKEEGVSFDYYVRTISIDEKLPWDVIDVGVKKEFLKKEYERALSG